MQRLKATNCGITICFSYITKAVFHQLDLSKITNQKQTNSKLTNSICRLPDIFVMLQKFEMPRVRLTPRKVLKGNENKLINPYKRCFLMLSCLIPGHTQTALFP